MQYKDAVFRKYFKEKVNALSLYKAVSGDLVPTEDTIEMIDLEGVFENGRRSDVVFTFGDQLIVMMEHQSTLNENMPLRFLAYLSRYYDRIIKTKPMYGKKRIHLPSPRFYVFYNGKTSMEEQVTMRLSEAFTDDSPMIELVVKAFNVNYGHNKELMEKCEQILHYSIFISKVEEYRTAGYTPKIAVRMATEYCIMHDIMKKFLQMHQEEVVDMFTEEWDMDEAMRVSREEGIKEGRRESDKIINEKNAYIAELEKMIKELSGRVAL